jgi:hypothetical protein
MLDGAVQAPRFFIQLPAQRGGAVVEGQCGGFALFWRQGEVLEGVFVALQALHANENS